jgi:hypothetical protein
MRFAREVGEYSWGLKVCKRGFLRVLRVFYEDVAKRKKFRLRSYNIGLYLGNGTTWFASA